MGFTSDWVSNKAEKWKELLAHLIGKPNLRFLEIGSYEGRSACWWLNNILTHHSSKLICIDPWTGRPEREQRFDVNTKRFGKKIEKRKGDSRLILPKLADGSIDFGYVDGCHEAGPALLDGILTLHKLKKGGIMIFDDYEHPGGGLQKLVHLPKKGIDAFLALYDFRIKVLHRGWQVAVRKEW